MPEPIAYGEFKLLHDVLIKAVLDSLSTDQEIAAEARAWLQETGAELAQHLQLATAGRVRRWVQSPSLPNVLSIEDVAQKTHVSVQKVRYAIKSGELPAFPAAEGKHPLCILPADVQEWELTLWGHRRPLQECLVAPNTTGGRDESFR